MKALIPLALVLALGLFPASGGAEEAAEDPPAWTLNTQENDGPELARLKAALRLMKHAQATVMALQLCGTPETGQALNGFKARNGNTLALAMNAIKKYGELTQEIKIVVDQEVAADTAALLQQADCRAVADLVAQNARDIYKAPELAADYRLVKEGP